MRDWRLRRFVVTRRTSTDRLVQMYRPSHVQRCGPERMLRITSGATVARNISALCELNERLRGKAHTSIGSKSFYGDALLRG